MKDLQTLRMEIASLNAQVDRLNDARAKNIGKREALEAQKKNLVAEYENKYGVQLTDENLETEFNRVMVAKTKEANLLSEVLTAINNHDYNHANALMGVEVERTTYGSDELIHARDAVKSKVFEVNTDGVVKTEMERRADALTIATEEMATQNTDTGVGTETMDTTPVELYKTPVTAPQEETAKPAQTTAPQEETAKPVQTTAPKTVPDFDEMDDFVPRVAPRVSSKARPAVGVKPVTAPVSPAQTQSNVYQDNAPMDALEGFTMPQQTAPKLTPSPFDMKPSNAEPQKKVHSFDEMFGSGFTTGV